MEAFRKICTHEKVDERGSEGGEWYKCTITKSFERVISLPPIVILPRRVESMDIVAIYLRPAIEIAEGCVSLLICSEIAKIIPGPIEIFRDNRFSYLSENLSRAGEHSYLIASVLLFHFVISIPLLYQGITVIRTIITIRIGIFILKGT